MRPTTPAYDRGYQTGALYIAKVELRDSLGAVIRDSSTFEVVDGSVIVDRSASFRRHLSGLVLLDLDGTIIPDQPDDLFSTTSGNEIKVYAGYRVDGIDHLFSQGVFGLQGATTHDTPQGVYVSIEAFDRARKMSRNRPYRPYVIPNNTNAVTAGTNLAQTLFPGITVISQATSFTIPYTVLDPFVDGWEELLDIMSSIGFEAFLNPDGELVFQAEPNPEDPQAPTVYSYQEGETATTLKLSRDSSNEEVANFFIVDGEHSYNITPPRGLAWDSDPASPTYAGDPTATPAVPPGPYGLVTRQLTEKKVTTAAQATASANGHLNRNRGATEVITFSIVPNPAHEEIDLVEVQRERSNVDARLFVDQMTIPLKAGSGPEMPVTTRKRRI